MHQMKLTYTYINCNLLMHMQKLPNVLLLGLINCLMGRAFLAAWIFRGIKFKIKTIPVGPSCNNNANCY